VFHEDKSVNKNNGLPGSGGGTRTPDTRIMMPSASLAHQELIRGDAVKPATGHQRLSSKLSNPVTGDPPPPEKSNAREIQAWLESKVAERDAKEAAHE
jgi:hypothetical protein